MRHLRCSTAGALGGVVAVAVGFVALREADERWDRWLFAVTLGVLLFAVVGSAHRTGDRRSFWVGFALCGWGYLGLALIPSAEPRWVVTEALVHLQRSGVFGIRTDGIRIVPDPNRMRAHDLSTDDIMRAIAPSSMISPAEFGQVALADGSVLSWDANYNSPKQYQNIIIRANVEGEILQIKDVAKVENALFSVPLVRAGSADRFIPIGHTLFALLVAELGGVLGRRLGSVPGWGRQDVPDRPGLMGDLPGK